MAVTIQCPECQEQYELEESMEGKALACKCELKFLVPDMSNPDSVEKICPGCEHSCEGSSILCTDCGYNFKTKKKVGASAVDLDEEDELDFFHKYFPIIKLAVIVVVLLVVGIIVYVSMTSKYYGISGSSPLGTFKEIEEHLLTNMRLQKSDMVGDTSEQFGVKAKIYRYKDKKLSEKTRGMLDEYAYIVVDSDGKICGVGGKFHTTSDAIPGTGSSKIRRFLRHFWNELELPKPEYKSITHGKGMFEWTEEVAEVNNESAKAKWSKTDSPTAALYSSTDNLAIALKEYSPDKLLNSSPLDFGSGSGGGALKSLIKSKINAK